MAYCWLFRIVNCEYMSKPSDLKAFVPALANGFEEIKNNRDKLRPIFRTGAR
jgi:hypothetical protein